MLYSNFHPTLILKNLIFLTYLGLVIFLPSLHFGNQDIIIYHDSQRLVELILISLILVYSATTALGWSQVIHVNHKIAVGVYLILGFASISAFLAISPRHSVIEISIFGGLCYLALLIVTIYEQNKHVFVKRLCYAIWVSILLYLVSFYAGYITAVISKTALNWPKPFSGFTNIRSFNQYQLWSLGLIYLPLLAFDIKPNIRLGVTVALSLWWVLLFYTASRGVLLAWLFGMVLTGLIYRKLAWEFLRLQITSIFTGFLGYYILFKIIPASLKLSLVTGSVLRQSTNDRIELWDRALMLAYDHPLFGIGPMNFPWYNASLSHPHNSVLQLATEWGLPATFILLSIAGYAGYCWLKQFNAYKLKKESRFNSNLAIVLFFTITANAAYSMVDGVIVMPISQVLMATIIGLMIAVYTSENKVIRAQKTITNKTKFQPMIATILLIAIIWSTLPEIRQGLSGSEKRFSIGYIAAGPRIWWEIK